eukprot:40833-Pyramimonas_sp.AAC.1
MCIRDRAATATATAATATATAATAARARTGLVFHAGPVGERLVALVHVQDEAAMKVKSFIPSSPNLSLGRYSKINNHVLRASFPRKADALVRDALPVFTELHALAQKNAATIAESIIRAAGAAIDAMLRGRPGVVLKIVHIIVGDAVPTNEAACKRVLHHFRQVPGLQYSMILVQCSSHQANLVVQ